MKFHNFLREYAGLPPEKRNLIPIAWIITLLWFFFGIGPGAVIGNWVFGDPTNPETVFRACSIFNSAAKRASLKLKYKPKIVDGKAVRVDNVPHKFTFLLEED